jgi:hypothetical protein
MYTALNASSQTLQDLLEEQLERDSRLGTFFDSDQVPGNMVVSLHTPQEMLAREIEGVSVWLYRVVRDDQRLNSPAVRESETQLRRAPLPVRLHYLITPIISSTEDVAGPELEQIVLGKVLEVLYDHPTQRGGALRGDFGRPDVELHIRLEPLSLEEITRVWDALDRSYQLSVSYEVSVVEIDSGLQPRRMTPVSEMVPESGSIAWRE